MRTNDLSKEQLYEQISDLQDRITSLEKTILAHSHIEEALKVSEKNLSAILKKNADGIVIINMEGIVLYVNPAAEILFGRRNEEFLGYPFGFPVLTDKKDDTLLIIKEGMQYEVEFRVVQVQWQGQPALQLSVRDITERILAQEALKESEEKCRIIFDKANDGMFLVDMETRKFFMCNASCARMLGYEQEEFPELEIADIHPAEDLPFIYEQIGKFSKGLTGIRNDIRFKCKNGNLITADMNPTLLPIYGKNYLLIIFRDITERKRMEDALRESEEKFKSITENSADAIFIADSTGKYVYTNKAVTDMLGFSPEEMKGKTITDMAPENSINEHAEMFKSLQVNGKVFAEIELLKKDGTFISTDLNSVILPGGLVYGSCRDISERKRAEERLYDSKEDLYRLLNSMAEGAYGEDINGKCTFVNRAFLQLLGYQDDHELLGKHLHEIIHHTHVDGSPYPLIDCEMHNVCQTHQSIHISDEVFWRKDGMAVPVEYWSHPMQKDGETIGSIVTFFDITERKQAEKVLRDSEARYSALFKASADGILIANIQTQQFKYANPALCRMLGYSEEELRTMGVADIHPKDSLQHIVAEFEAQGRGDKSLASEIPCLCKDGSIIYVDISTVMVIIDNVACNIGFFRDITERKQAEKEILDLAKFPSENPNPVIRLDYDGIILYANEASKMLLQDWGCTVGDTVPKFWYNTITDSYASKLNQIIEVEQGQQVYSFYITPIVKEGYINLYGIDITERRKTQEKFAWEKYLTDTLLANIPDSIYFKDLENRFLRINKAMAKLFGLNDPKDAIGMTDEDFFNAEHAQKSKIDEGQIIKTGIPIINKEVLEILENKQLSWVLTTKMPLKDIHGNIIGTFGISRDINKQKQTEEELLQAKERAEESDRLKTSFLNNISHEIRTPMNAIVGFSGLLNAPNLDTGKRQYYIDLVVQSSDNLLSIIDDIVRIASIEAGQEKIQVNEVNLNSLCKLIHEQFRSKDLARNVELSYNTTLTDDDAIILTDAIKLTQILTNLVGNALKFTLEGNVNFGYEVKNSQLEFYVKDSGIGISPEMHEEIFKRFRQADSSPIRQFGGSGLGLSISKAYIELLGGKIWLSSELDKGTTFYFTLPYNKVQPEELPKISSHNELNVNLENLNTLLIAEDDNINYLLLEEIFSNMNIKIIRALNGIEAVEICKSTQLDMVLMDIKMPKMDGYEAAKRIKEIKPDLTIIAQTAYSNEEDRKKASACGISDFISKPLNREMLFFKINEQLLK